MEAGAPSLALLHQNEPQRSALQARLQKLGHTCFVFSDADELLLALGKGQRFSLLLMDQQEAASSSGLSAVSRVLGMSVLLVVENGRWDVLSLGLGDEAGEHGGNFGADVSRVSDAELDWLVRIFVRRAGRPRPTGHTDAWGGYSFHEASRMVQFDGRAVHLQPRQFAFALQMFQNIGTVVERKWLLESLWRVPSQRGRTRALDSCACAVRRELGLQGGNGFVLSSVYGRGYRLLAVPPLTPPVLALV